MQEEQYRWSVSTQTLSNMPTGTVWEFPCLFSLGPCNPYHTAHPGDAGDLGPGM